MGNLNEIEANEVTERDNLAVVARVEKLETIPNKDRIELVYLKDVGYTFICEKGHKVGDLVVYVKYDSVVPDNELFSFMRETKFRVKPKSFTERDEEDNIVKKIYSQGIVLPIKTVINFFMIKTDGNSSTLQYTLIEGFDATQILSIKKYIPPQSGSGSSFGNMSSKGDFPTHIVSKTDEMNLAAKVRALDELQGKDIYITQKIEGSSLTVTWDIDRDELMVCSRNNQIGEHETNKFWQAVNKYDLKAKLKHFPDIVLQAELYGVGIQKNKLGIDGVDLAVFNVSSKLNRNRYGYDETVRHCEMLEVPFVPLVAVIENFNMTFDQLQELSDSQVYANGEVAEGIVVRPTEPFISKVLKSDWSVKVLNREYKL